MPFGLKNAAQAFQRLMDGIFKEVNFVFVYLDDILVASPNLETHQWHLMEFFTLLSSHGVSINHKKCVFGQQDVKYLGHMVPPRVISPLHSRVQDL